ncbi:ERF family protein [Streptococcus cristatus]|uniref:ERF family protein n=1 Tax=Streptococcus cristatus TaxID=45634 RepID=UPI001CC00D19|nr:ERF family protein [Streptococcus cristatus]MBZ2152831.1 ERF family protein [Streptococcus cristatus]
MADLTFPELQRQMQLGKQKKQGVSYSFRNVEDITTKFKELDSGWVLTFEDCDPIELQGRLFYKAVAVVNKGDEVHKAPGYAELSEVPIIKTRTGNTIQQMQVPQWTGAVSSYARKYAVQGLFAIGEKDVDEYPVEESQEQGQTNQQQQPQEQNQVRYIDNIQCQEIIKSIEEIAMIKGVLFDTIANFVLNKYQIDDFHKVPVDGYNIVMDYLTKQIQKAHEKQGG